MAWFLYEKLPIYFTHADKFYAATKKGDYLADQKSYLVMAAHVGFRMVYEGVIHLDYLRIAIKRVHVRNTAANSREVCIFCNCSGF